MCHWMKKDMCAVILIEMMTAIKNLIVESKPNFGDLVILNYNYQEKSNVGLMF